MLRKSVLWFSLCVVSSSAWAAEVPAADDAHDEEQSAEPLSESEKATALEYTQKELQSKFQSAVGLDLGHVMPWSKIGVSFFSKTAGNISLLSLGFGDFDYSGNLDSRNYVVEGDATSAFIASRFFVLGFGPLYVEPALGVVHWSGDVKPRGSDSQADVAASALTSRFDLLGLDLDAKVGVMWIFRSGLFLDCNLVNFSHALLFQESYTVSTHETRKAIRAQIAGPISMSSLNLRFGYALDF